MAFSLSGLRANEAWDPLICNHEAGSHITSDPHDKKRGSRDCNDLISVEGRTVQSRTREVGREAQAKKQKVCNSEEQAQGQSHGGIISTTVCVTFPCNLAVVLSVSFQKTPKVMADL